MDFLMVVKVGEHAAKPAVVHIEHPAAFGFFLDSLLGLLLGADEEHALAGSDAFADGFVGFLDGLDGFLQVDDVDAVALRKDELLHPRIPALDLVSEMDAGFKKILHRDDGQEVLLMTAVRSVRPPSLILVVADDGGRFRRTRRAKAPARLRAVTSTGSRCRVG